MTSEVPRRHRCGGYLHNCLVEIPGACPPMIVVGMRCDLCGEELLSASTVLELEAYL